MNRGNIFTQGEIFHIFNKSIAKYGIFKDLNNCQRFIQALDYYNNHNYGTNLGNYLKKNKNYFPQLLDIDKISFLKFISYCVMPDHYHLVIKILKESILSKYINDLANSYTRYLNDIITEISISDPKKFKKFCENNIDYQKKLRAIKKLLLE